MKFFATATAVAALAKIAQAQLVSGFLIGDSVGSMKLTPLSVFADDQHTSFRCPVSFMLQLYTPSLYLDFHHIIKSLAHTVKKRADTDGFVYCFVQMPTYTLDFWRRYCESDAPVFMKVALTRSLI